MLPSKPFEIHVYLAGPDVFEPDAIERGAKMKEYLTSLSADETKVFGHFPFDNEIDPKEFANPQGAALLIARLNEKMMRECCGEGKIGVIIANMNPFHGPSMDTGTAFEMGFMSALSTIYNVVIAGYSASKVKFAERVAEQVYKGDVTEKDGRTFGSDGKSIENFGGEENLMPTSSIKRESNGGKIHKTFEEAADWAVKIAKERAAIKMQEKQGGALAPAI